MRKMFDGFEMKTHKVSEKFEFIFIFSIFPFLWVEHSNIHRFKIDARLLGHKCYNSVL